MSSSQVPQHYGIPAWGAGYFDIGRNGHLQVRPDPDRPETIDLHALAHALRDDGLRWPVLVRFSDILRHRVRSLVQAFAEAGAELDYQGGYTAIYPIKVNQQHSVVREILAGGGQSVGLEAGSKPELMAVLAVAPPGSVIVCNGYKDREYLRLALIGRRLGHRVYIVIEKPTELTLVLREAEAMQIEPLLGVRVRLAAVASGKWQNSGGEKSKFGLSASQVLAMVETLAASDRLGWLRLLHSHIGSQIPNLRDIHGGLTEVARYYAELRRLGVPLEVVDVGGGLGVDYEGTGTRHYCSTNYGVAAYAREVVRAMAAVCLAEGLPPPELFTESGRAMTAHHAVLITNLIDREGPRADSMPPTLSDTDPEVLHRLRAEIDALARHAPSEVFQEGSLLFDEVRSAFEHGGVSLAVRAKAERLFYSLAEAVRGRLRADSRRDRELLDQLDEMLAERVFCNLSVFQSLPDVWAIGQIFPVMPLQRLHEPTAARVLLQDLTCDSDGCVTQYVCQDGIDATLPLHRVADGETYLLGIFLTGAYQEILGDMHNLFGDTDAVNVTLDERGGYRLSQAEQGDAIDELLRYVHFEPEALLAAYRRKLQAAGLAETWMDDYYQELKAGLHGYTYFED